MAQQQINGQRWPDGTTVAVHPAAAWTNQSTAPSGSALTYGEVEDGRVVFDGLQEKVRYVAYAAGVGVTFVVPAGTPGALPDRTRIEVLEDEVEDLDLLGLSVRNVMQPTGIFAGAVGGGSVDDTAAILAHRDALEEAGGGVLYFPAETFLLSDPDLDERCVTLFDHVKIWGAGKGRTILKLAPGTNASIFGGERDGSTYYGYDDVTLMDLTLDGDALSSTVAEGESGLPLLHTFNSSGLRLYRCSFTGSRSYGFGAQGYPAQANVTARGPQADTYIESCDFHANGFRLTGDATTFSGALDATDTTPAVASEAALAVGKALYVPSTGEKMRVLSLAPLTVARGAYATTAAAADSGATVRELTPYDDGLDAKSSQRWTLIACNAYGNANDGFDIRARWLSMTGCHAWGNHTTGINVGVAEVGVDLVPTDGYATLTGCSSRENLRYGFEAAAAAGRVGRPTFEGCWAHGNVLGGLNADAGGGEMRVSVLGGSYSENLGVGVIFDACAVASLDGVDCDGNLTNGVQVDDMPTGFSMSGGSSTGNDRGIRLTGTTDYVRCVGATLRGNTTANVTATGSTNNVFRDCDTGADETAIVASDAAFTLTPFVSAEQTIHTGTLTANRAVTLSMSSAQKGMKFRVARSGGGAFNLTVGGKALATGQWSEHTFDGTAWVPTAFGSL